MPAGPPKSRVVSVRIEEDDFVWAKLHGYDISERSREHLKAVRRDVEIASYGLILKRQPRVEREEVQESTTEKRDA